MMTNKQKLLGWWLSFWPQPLLASRRDRIAGSMGAAMGLIATEWLSRHALGGTNPWFIAPMGASAVLLFGVPASPLAQPWSIVGGNLVAALVGVSCAHWINPPGLAAGLAAAIAIGLMFPLRCLHPPSGAVALTAVLGGPAIAKLGYGFVLYPVLANSLVLVSCALVFNNVLRRRYPHHAVAILQTPAATEPPSERVGISRADLHAVLEARGELLDIDEDDLRDILMQADSRAHRRRFGELRCADFMTREVLTITPDASCLKAGSLLREYRFDALPVLSQDGKLVGMVTPQDLLPQEDDGKLFSMSLRKVMHVMRKDFYVSRLDDAIEALVQPLADQAVPCSFVIDGYGRLVGIVTAADVLAALYREQIEALDTKS